LAVVNSEPFSSHDGGLNAKLYLNGKEVCAVEAIYGLGDVTSVQGETWETIVSYTQCPEAIQIKIGDKLKMTSEYDVSKHKL
jgi:hypothetical protein